MSIFTLNNASLTIAGTVILDKANLQIQSTDRIALVGRNGAGKSTLLSVIQGQLSLDEGQLNKVSGLRIAGLMQEVPNTSDDSVYKQLVKGLGEVGEAALCFHQLSNQNEDLEKLSECQQQLDNLNGWDLAPKIEAMANHLGIALDASMNQLSGGMKRRVLLAAALLANPDLLLLDEPTNHLDLEGIEWLERYLKSFKGAVVVVTHDREFLKQVSNKIIEIDRGTIFVHDCDYPTYLERRDSIRASEEKHNALFDKKLAEEEAWIRTGIKARRTRNEGRVRALKSLREQYKARRNQMGRVSTLSVEVNRSGSMVIEALNLNYSINDKKLIHDFSLLLMRGDKLGIIGPNGCGKTTLLRLLLGELQADSGTVKQGTSLEIAYFDQLRRQLLEDKTVLYNVGDGSDYVTVNGQKKHVASYLSDFLFSKERFNQPVSVLSGGERNRLLLAKLFARPVNFLVMDEPTNDLDIETLELLESMLVEFKGTLVVISHDREFINNVVTSVLVYEGEGSFNEYVGGYQDYVLLKEKQKTEQVNTNPAPKPKQDIQKLSYNEQRELAQLPKKIEQVEKKIDTLHAEMAKPGFYQQDSTLVAEISQKLNEEEALLAELFARWEFLEDK